MLSEAFEVDAAPRGAPIVEGAASSAAPSPCARGARALRRGAAIAARHDRLRRRRSFVRMAALNEGSFLSQ